MRQHTRLPPLSKILKRFTVIHVGASDSQTALSAAHHHHHHKLHHHYNHHHHHHNAPIYVAAQEGHAECLKLLLASHADPRSNYKGTSALDIARKNQHAEYMRLLEAALA